MHDCLGERLTLLKHIGVKVLIDYVDSGHFQPTDVGILLGNPTNAKEKFGYTNCLHSTNLLLK